MAKVRTKKVYLAINIVVILALLGSTGYLFMDNRNLNKELNLSESERTDRDNKKVIDKVAKLMSLPEGEPVVILVNSPEEVRSSEGDLEKVIATLFEDLKKGDYLVIYTKARQGIQYRPSENKIIKTADIAFAINIELVGSQTAVKKAEETLIKQFGTQVAITKTVKDGVTQNLVFDIDTDQQAEAESIAKQLTYEKGETVPSTIKPADQTEILVTVAETRTSTTPPATEQSTETSETPAP